MVALFIWDRSPVIVVTTGAAPALYASGIPDPAGKPRGFGDPAIFVASLFVVSAGSRYGRDHRLQGADPDRAGQQARLLIWTMGFRRAERCPHHPQRRAVAALLPVVV